MIFWIFVILLVIGVVLLFADYYFGIDSFALEASASITSLISGIVVVIMLIFIVANNLSAQGAKLANQQTYDSIIYKSQTESIRDEFGIVNKEYIDEVQAWNENVVKYKSWQRDFWIGIFIPNIYDDLETIDLDSIQYKE